MGITGLIPFLEKATRKVTLKDLKGSRVGVDTYCWLHKGAISCADKLIRGDATDMHIQYCLKYVNLLLSNGIKPVLVFDGRHLPAKALTERRRGASRKEAKEKAKELLREGKVNEARSYINRSVNITHDMAHQLMELCRKRNVDCIVAPYEADGQLAFLSRRKIIDYVITEDSDLTLFGCDKVIFKFDLTGQGLLFEAERLYMAMGCKQEKFEFRRFEMMAILSGCDYLDSLKGVGLAKACKFVMMTEETDMKRCLRKIPQYLNLKGVTVEDVYVEGFLRAMFTFRHMIVYDPTIRRQVHLTEPAEEDLPFCDNAGEKLSDDELAFQMAIGNVNPFTMKQIDSWDPSELNTDKYPSIWGHQGGGGNSSKKGSSNTIITVNPKPDSAKKRKVLHKPIEDEDNVNHAMNTSVDIMNKYLDQPKEEVEPINAIESPPEAKKIRLSRDDDRARRNPFIKRKEILDSTADGDNNGAGDGEEKKMHFSLLKQANSIKTENNNPSKFKKTTPISKKVSVVSRFFSPGGTAVKNENETEVHSSKTPEENKQSAKDSPEQMNEVPAQQENTTQDDEGIAEPEPESSIKNTLEDEGVSEQQEPTSQVAEDPSEPKQSQTDSDSEGFMDCSAFVEAQFSDSEMQRENEQSPVPWQLGIYSQEDHVQDTLNSQALSDKENVQDANHNKDNDNCILLSDDDQTPKKIKSPVKKKKLKALPLKKPKQPTLMSFFQKKTR